MGKLKCNPLEVEKLIFKDAESISNYTHVSIEEMDYMMELAIKYQVLHEAWYMGIEHKEPSIFFLRKCKEVIEDVKPDYRKVMK
ncbi:hypothetical protein [Lysinibacillus fusiformis]|uniref:hypothetical protein n=1 Tax=Lysinibacillus fusiformis TaxID=28031 RepID=UPI00263B62D9|nr:hypothetical protein [Lysinibacillus fusiformis]MDC6267252.1 hypothetical protein [Lysinibacillus sphaericus]MDN4968314.1 hypothetical protein [Lysinibacillus fusiformis]MDN4968488.1 hypothetical protein [Lysinibacillus fusiformis]